VGFEAATPETWNTTFDVNLRGAMLTARAALPVLDPGSSMVFTSTIGAIRGNGTLLAYEASKAALAPLMRAVAIARKEDGVRANIVMPGIIDTGLGRNAALENPNRTAIPVPLGRQGTGWEVAYATLFLLSQESAYITGQTLAVDGGRTTI
jgi:NAD(P)-dependent dehydrogenase (short-subunit alcohol dehydrogenase family)